MRKVICATMVSLDGVIQAPGGPDEDPTGGFTLGGWSFPYHDESTEQIMGHLFEEPYDLLLGRKTYEIFAAYWPYQDDPIGKAFNRAHKYVATRSRDQPLAWEASTRLEDAPADVARLRSQEGPPLLIQGSGNLIQSLHADGQIDEYKVMTYPLVLGRGKRLFEDGALPAGLTLTHHMTSRTGVIAATYLPAGEVKPGSFVAGDVSEAELARRARWNREG